MTNNFFKPSKSEVFALGRKKMMAELMGKLVTPFNKVVISLHNEYHTFLSISCRAVAWVVSIVSDKYLFAKQGISFKNFGEFILYGNHKFEYPFFVNSLKWLTTVKEHSFARLNGISEINFFHNSKILDLAVQR